jgi:hypothetical protein
MPVKQGTVDVKVVTVLRDSGCSSAVIRRSLISSSQLTGEYKTCILIDGTIRKVPVAVVQVNTPYYFGEVACLCMTNPVYDLILGNIDGVRDPSEPDKTWQHPNMKHKTGKVHIDPPDLVNAVETRGQKVVKEKAVKGLKVPKAMTEIVTAEKLQEAQEADTTLDKFRELANSGEVKVTRNGGNLSSLCRKVSSTVNSNLRQYSLVRNFNK